MFKVKRSFWDFLFLYKSISHPQLSKLDCPPTTYLPPTPTYLLSHRPAPPPHTPTPTPSLQPQHYPPPQPIYPPTPPSSPAPKKLSAFLKHFNVVCWTTFVFFSCLFWCSGFGKVSLKIIIHDDSSRFRYSTGYVFFSRKQLCSWLDFRLRSFRVFTLFLIVDFFF